ncbi:MAG: fumarylacetoacetate hydrolase family protein [Planctomycetia bacterium]
MHLCRIKTSAGVVRVGQLVGDQVLILPESVGRLCDVLHDDDPAGTVARAAPAANGESIAARDAVFLAPIDRQEVWAAGVTYRRSQQARMEESEQGASFYDKVYSAPRPELFFKATPHRVAGPNEPIRVRRDTKWCVPEPEFTLVVSPLKKLVGYTIGNDMSARDIEGENPLYLPQAKTYDQSAGLGPVVVLTEGYRPLESVNIHLTIERSGSVAFEGSTSLASMKRTFDELIGWLGIDNSFPDGVFLMTGTGIVPNDDFTLHAGDVVAITVDGIGTLRNPVTIG